ncbi:aldehyde dehydrogenase 5, mitochondrial [Trichomonascus vanleenenianus]|uniref:aldehyde dehydrogenase family protein n=1 Tax=Trichomonascus vanleenenianus TaxID=2268995 RepID=UPI003ECA57C0
MTKLTTISPISSKPIISTDATTLEHLDRTVLPTAQMAQKQWAEHSLADRKKVVKKFIDHLLEPHTLAKLAKEITEQMGRPIRYTPGEIKTAALRAQTMMDFADEALAPVPVKDGQEGFKKYLSHEPQGVVLIIFPWNYPYLCLVNGLVPALLAGNSVLIKPSPQTPRVADSVVELFHQAGLPIGVLQAVHTGDPETIEKLISRKAISAVSFTGSVFGGLEVQKAAAGRTIPVNLELGGNDAAYVRADVADIKATAADIVDGALFNTGQSCCSIERIYVEADVYDQFVEAVVEEVKSYKVGDPFDEATQLGPVISEKSARTIKAQIKDAVERGAKKLIPDGWFKEAEALNPTFVGPQVLVDLDETSLVVQEETFGPVIPIIKVNSDEEAVEKINDSDYGLTASVWTSDIERGEELGNEIEAGTVFVNRCDYPDPSLAWTGYKNSGRGVSLSKYGYTLYTKIKSHHIKKV